MNILNNNVSFGEKYNFLQNQQGLTCIYCGKTILSDRELKKINKSLEGKKGIEIAEILTPYLEYSNGNNIEPLKELISLAYDDRFQNCNFKNLTMHLTKKDIYTPNTMQSLKNLLRPICFSVEHIVPKSKGGKNVVTNYMPMHIDCNSGRSSESYAAVMIQNPNFATNIRKSLGQIKSRMLSDRNGSSHYGINLPDNFIEEATRNISSQGIDKSLLILD